MDETNLPNDGSTQQEPVPMPVPEKRYLTPEAPAKPKTDIGFFILGFFAPIVLNAVTAGIGVAINAASSQILGEAAGALYLLSAAPAPLLLVAMIISFFVGKQKGNVRLKSFGLGGLVFYATAVLMGLLLFGSCLVLGASSGFLG